MKTKAEIIKMATNYYNEYAIFDGDKLLNGIDMIALFAILINSEASSETPIVRLN